MLPSFCYGLFCCIVELVGYTSISALPGLGYWVDLLFVFHSGINQIKGNKSWCLFAFQSSAYPEKCHWIATLFHLFTVSFFFSLVFFFFNFTSLAKKHTETVFFAPKCSDSLGESAVGSTWDTVISVCVKVAFGRKNFTECLMLGLSHLPALKKAQGDKLGMPSLAKGQTGHGWDCFSVPYRSCRLWEGRGFSAPTGGSVSTPLPQSHPFSEAHYGSSGNNNNNAGKSAMVANKQTFLYLTP